MPFAKDPKNNSIIIPRSISSHAFIIDASNVNLNDHHEFIPDIPSIPFTLVELAGKAYAFYAEMGAGTLSVRPTEKYIEIGFLTQEEMENALNTPFIFQDITFNPILAICEDIPIKRIWVGNLPNSDKTGVGKDMEETLRPIFAEYGEVLYIEHLLFGPQIPGAFTNNAIVIIIPNEDIISGKTTIPRSEIIGGSIVFFDPQETETGYA